QLDGAAPRGLLLDRGPRVVQCPVELQPGGHRAHVVTPRQRDAEPAVTGTHQPGTAPATPRTMAAQPEQRSALGEQGERVRDHGRRATGEWLDEAVQPLDER